MQIMLEQTHVQEIPILTLSPAQARQLPIVFFIPGYGGRKEAGLSLGYRLARRGFFFLSLDPWLHGERYDRRLDMAAEPELGGIYPPETGLDTGVTFFSVIQRCLEDVQTLLAHYAGDPRLDLARCGVTGLSMGGCASYLIFAHLPQIQAAVPMIGIPAFSRRWTDLLDECSYSNPDWSRALQTVTEQSELHAAFIQQLDPVEHLQQAAPRALLMVNCDFDCDQPKHYAIETYRQLLPSYRSFPENLRLNIYPSGHAVTAAMEGDAVDWFSQHLIEQIQE